MAKNEKSQEELNLTALRLLDAQGSIHVIGRTYTRTADIKDIIGECKREEVAFLEESISYKDNHTVMIFQVIQPTFMKSWPEKVYYVLLADQRAIFGKDVTYGEVP